MNTFKLVIAFAAMLMLSAGVDGAGCENNAACTTEVGKPNCILPVGGTGDKICSADECSDDHGCSGSTPHCLGAADSKACSADECRADTPCTDPVKTECTDKAGTKECTEPVCTTACTDTEVCVKKTGGGTECQAKPTTTTQGSTETATSGANGHRVSTTTGLILMAVLVKLTMSLL